MINSDSAAINNLYWDTILRQGAREAEQRDGQKKRHNSVPLRAVNPSLSISGLHSQIIWRRVKNLTSNYSQSCTRLN